MTSAGVGVGADGLGGRSRAGGGLGTRCVHAWERSWGGGGWGRQCGWIGKGGAARSSGGG